MIVQWKNLCLAFAFQKAGTGWPCLISRRALSTCPSETERLQRRSWSDLGGRSFQYDQRHGKDLTSVSYQDSQWFLGAFWCVSRCAVNPHCLPSGPFGKMPQWLAFQHRSLHSGKIHTCILSWDPLVWYRPSIAYWLLLTPWYSVSRAMKIIQEAYLSRLNTK